MESKIFGIRTRKYLLGAIVLQVVSLLLSIIIMLPDIPWASQGSDSKYWKGDLTQVTSGNHSGESYADLEMHYDTDDDNVTDYVEGQDRTFQGLTFGSIFYIMLEILAIIFNVVTGLSMVCVKKFRYCIICLMISSFFQAIVHFCAFLIWVLLSDVTFTGRCSKSNLSYDDHYQAPVCAQVGPVLSMLVLIFYIILSLGWYLIGTIHLSQYRYSLRNNPRYDQIEL
jgi:hypothetical protein